MLIGQTVDTQLLKREVREIQDVSQLFQYALAVIAGIKKAPLSLAKNEGFRSLK